MTRKSPTEKPEIKSGSAALEAKNLPLSQGGHPSCTRQTDSKQDRWTNTDLDEYTWLVVGVGGEGLGLLGGDGGVALDEGCHHPTGRLDTHGQGGNVQQEQVLHLLRLVTVQNGRLHSCKQRAHIQMHDPHFNHISNCQFKNICQALTKDQIFPGAIKSFSYNAVLISSIAITWIVAQTSKEGLVPSSKQEFLWWKPRM